MQNILIFSVLLSEDLRLEGADRGSGSEQVAADMIDEYVAKHAAVLSADVVKRVFVLTDGADNASTHTPSGVAIELQRRGIVLDAIPLAGSVGSPASNPCVMTPVYMPTCTQLHYTGVYCSITTLYKYRYSATPLLVVVCRFRG